MAVSRTIHGLFALLLLGLAACGGSDARGTASWADEWPDTDFSRASVPLHEIRSVVDRGSIPAIFRPKFVSVANANHLHDTEPVIGVVLNGEARAYPLQILVWHEIVNDDLGGVPIAITFCPLCNAAVVFDRRLGDQSLKFGVSGKLRHSDLIMYDLNTKSWWQQFTGEAIVGTMTGAELNILPARLESFVAFKTRTAHLKGEVLVPRKPGQRAYGDTPYAGYDSAEWPFLYEGMPRQGGKRRLKVPPLSRVVTVETRAWSLAHVRRQKRIETSDGLVITWTPGQNSALDREHIADSFDVGNVVVQRVLADGTREDVPYGIDFAFAFHAFYRHAEIVIR